MWPAPDDLTAIATLAGTCLTWLPVATTILRFATAVTAFAVVVHRTVRYVRSTAR